VRSLEGSGRLKLPTWTEHADFCNPFAFIDLLSELDGLPDTDIMLEAKARDVALLKLREDVARFAPEWRDRLL
jgi:UV DNA damage endonuclease